MITQLETPRVAKGQTYLPKDVVKLHSYSEHFPVTNRASPTLRLFFILLTLLHWDALVYICDTLEVTAVTY